jgi:hypothetical protein
MTIRRLIARLQTRAAKDTDTSSEVRSPTSTSTEVRSPTSTSTDAYTQGNITITGGGGDGDTNVYIGILPPSQPIRADEAAHQVRSDGSAQRVIKLMDATGQPRLPAPTFETITNKDSSVNPQHVISRLQVTAHSKKAVIASLRKERKAIQARMHAVWQEATLFNKKLAIARAKLFKGPR